MEAAKRKLLQVLPHCLVKSCTDVMANSCRCHHLVDLELHAPTSVRSPARLQELALGCRVAPQKGIEQDMTGPYRCSCQRLSAPLTRTAAPNHDLGDCIQKMVQK